MCSNVFVEKISGLLRVKVKLTALRGDGEETIEREGECRGESRGELASDEQLDPELVSSLINLPSFPPTSVRYSTACPEQLNHC